MAGLESATIVPSAKTKARRRSSGKLKSESFRIGKDGAEVIFTFNRPLTLLELEGLVASIDRAIAR